MSQKISPLLLLVTGIVVLLYALLFMDVSIGGEVVNLDLLNTRQNLVIVGSLTVLLGAIWMAAIRIGPNEPTGQSKLGFADFSLVGIIKLASLIFIPIGIWQTYIYLFSPIDEANGLFFSIGLALYCVPWLLYRSALTKSGAPRLSVINLMTRALLVLIVAEVFCTLFFGIA